MDLEQAEGGNGAVAACTYSFLVASKTLLQSSRIGRLGEQI